MNNTILQQFDAQRHRGTEGFGLFDGQETHIVKAATEDKIINWLCKYDSNMILFHHRYPTSTINVKRAAHPFSTKNYFGESEYILVHNGMIRNDEELWTAHDELGIRYQSMLDDGTFNDSEALLWDFALTMEGKQKELKAYGGIAFVVVKKTGGYVDKLYFGRNSSPLNMLRDRDGLMLSSEGEGVAITPQTLYTYNYKLKRLTTKFMSIKSFLPTPYTGGYQNKGLYDWQDNWEAPLVDRGRKTLGAGKAGDWLPKAVRDRFDTYLKGREEPEVIVVGRYSDVDIENRAMDYIIAANGHFESAYWAVEMDYENAEEDAELGGNDGEVRMLERVLDYILKDEEYINEASVSSVWRALCQR